MTKDGTLPPRLSGLALGGTDATSSGGGSTSHSMEVGACLVVTERRAGHLPTSLPTSLAAFVRSGYMHDDVLSSAQSEQGAPSTCRDALEEEADGSSSGKGDGEERKRRRARENAARVALALTRLVSSCHSNLCWKTMRLEDFSLVVARNGAGAVQNDVGNGARIPLRMVLDPSTESMCSPCPGIEAMDAATILPSLGRLLYSIFSFGDLPPADLVPPTTIATAAIESPAINGEASSSRASEGGEATAAGRSSKSNSRRRSRRAFAKLVERNLFPVAVCQLLSDLFDAGRAEGGTSSRFASLEEVTNDLEQMAARPDVFLHSPPTGDGGPVPVFGRASYGRDEELALVRGITDRMVQSAASDSLERTEVGGEEATTNHPRLEAVFVAAMAGSGKSRLVQSFVESLPRSRWVVIKAKFERESTHASTTILSSMFDKLVSFLVEMKGSGHPSRTEYSHRASQVIAESIGSDRLPSLANFLPSLPSLYDGAHAGMINNFSSIYWQSHEGGTIYDDGAEQRLIDSLTKIIEAVLSDRFLVICCDDLQWADKSALVLIGEILARVGSLTHVRGRCLFVGLVRDNEIDDAHPFAEQCAYLQRMSNAINMTKIELSSLAKEVVGEMLMSEFRLPRRFVEELADIVHKKTSGHAYFVVELLNSLLRDSVIAYSPLKYRYDWDQDRIDMIQTGKSVAELIASNISSMPASSRRILHILSCFGTQTDLSLLHLLEEFQEGIVTAVDAFVEQGILDRAGPIFMFAHDLIQEQVYESMPMSERQRLHLSLGQFLGERAGADSTPQVGPGRRGLDELHEDKRTFYTGRSSMTSSLIAISCDQINAAGLDAVAEDSQRVRFATWNLAAGQQARILANSCAARFYYSHGVEYLGPDCWQKHSGSLCLTLYEGAALAAFTLGKFDEVVRYAEMVVRHVSFEDSLVIQRVHLKALRHSGKHSESVHMGLSILRQLNFDIPSEPSPASVAKCLAATDEVASKLSKDQILDGCKRAVDDSVYQMLKVVDDVYASCYAASSSFLPMVACTIVQFSLKNGISLDSASAFAVYAMLKVSTAGDYAAARYWADMALEVEATHQRLDKSNTKRLTFAPMILVITVEVWFSSPKKLAQKLLSCHHKAKESGQLDIAMPTLVVSCRYSLLGGENLSLVKRMYQDRQNLVAKHSIYFAKKMALGGQLLRVLTGESGDYDSIFKNSVFSMDELQEEANASKDNQLVQQLHVWNVIIEFWRGDYAAAEEHSRLAWMMERVAKLPCIGLIYHTFFCGIVKFARYRSSGDDQRLKDGREMMDKMGVWAQNSMEVFENKWHLLRAEYHASVGEFDQALQMYQLSIKSSQDHGNIHELALAYELLGNHHSARRCRAASIECFQKAFVYYTQWGATAVAERIRALGDASQLQCQQTSSSPSDSVESSASKRSYIEVNSVPSSRGKVATALTDPPALASSTSDEEKSSTSSLNSNSEDPRMGKQREVKRPKPDPYATKVEYDRLLKDHKKLKGYTGIEVVKHSSVGNAVRVIKKGQWSNKRMAVSLTRMLLSEAALGADFTLRLDIAMRPLSHRQQLEYLRACSRSPPPGYVACDACSIPRETVAAATSSRNARRPFNFPNPSLVDAERREEIERRQLNVSAEFPYERKVSIFHAVVSALISVIR